jgi:uncharacterized protein (UPF0303 family)
MAKRKRSNRQQTRKPRVPLVSIGFDRDVAISHIEFGGDQRLIFKDERGNVLEPEVVTVGHAYWRRRKLKVVRQLPTEPNNIVLDVKRWLRDQEATLAVDTSYKDLGGCRLCVSAFILIRYEMHGQKRMAEFSPQSSVVFVAPDAGNPERFGWWDILQRFSESPYYDPHKSYGLIVDSDLNDLSTINSRDAALWGRRYLPEGFHLVYASSDTGQESYINQAITMCDRLAKSTLAHVLEVTEPNKVLKEFSGAEHRLCYVTIVAKDSDAPQGRS